MSDVVADFPAAPKTIIASRLTGEIRCVPSDSAQFMETMKDNQWFLVCSEPEELCNLERAAPVKPEERFTFEAVGGTVKKTPHGLSYVPLRIDGNLVLKPGQTELRLAVNHFHMDYRQMPRRADAVAELEAQIAECLPRRGIVTVPFRPLETWTMRTFRKAIGAMVRHLPDAPSDPKQISVSTDKYPHDDFHRVQVSSYLPGHHYSVELRLRGDVCPAKFWWKYMGSLEALDAKIQEHERKNQPKNRPGSRDEELNDHELSWIEKAARKRLHGHKDEDDDESLPVPPPVAAVPDVPASLIANLAALGKIGRNRLKGLEDLVAVMLKNAEGGQ